MTHLKKQLGLFIILISLSTPVLAIPPPEFILSGLQSVMQLIGIVVAFFISMFFLTKDLLKNLWTLHRKKAIAVLIFITLLSLIIGIIIYKKNV